MEANFNNLDDFPEDTTVLGEEEEIDVGNEPTGELPREIPSRAYKAEKPTPWEAVLSRLLLKSVDPAIVAGLNNLKLTVEDVKNIGNILSQSATHVDKVHVADMTKVEQLKEFPDVILEVLRTGRGKQQSIYGAHFHFWCFAHKFIRLQLVKDTLCFTYGDIVYRIPDTGHVNQKAASTFLAQLNGLTGNLFTLETCSGDLCDAAYAFATWVKPVDTKTSSDNMSGGYEAPYTSVAVPDLGKTNAQMKAYIDHLKRLVAGVKARPNTNMNAIEWFCKIAIDNNLRLPKHPFPNALDYVAKVPYAGDLTEGQGRQPKNYSIPEARSLIVNFETTLVKARAHRVISKWNSYTHDWSTPVHAYGYVDTQTPAMKFAETVIRLVKTKVWRATDPVVVVGDPRHFDPVIKGLGLTPTRKVAIGHTFNALPEWDCIAVTSYDSDETAKVVAKESVDAWLIQAATSQASSAAAKGSDYTANRGLISRLACKGPLGVLLQVFVERAFLASGSEDFKKFSEVYTDSYISRPWRQHNADYLVAFWVTDSNASLSSDAIMAKFTKKLALLTMMGRRYSDIRNVAMHFGLPGLPSEFKEITLSPSFAGMDKEVPLIYSHCLTLVPTSELGKQAKKEAAVPLPDISSTYESLNEELGVSMPKGASTPSKQKATPSGKDEEEGEIPSEEEIPLKKKSGTIATKKAPASKKPLGPALSKAVVSAPPPSPPEKKKAEKETPKKKAPPKKATKGRTKSAEVVEPEDSDHDKPRKAKPKSKERPATDDSSNESKSKSKRRKNMD